MISYKKLIRKKLVYFEKYVFLFQSNTFKCETLFLYICSSKFGVKGMGVPAICLRFAGNRISERFRKNCLCNALRYTLVCQLVFKGQESQIISCSLELTGIS